MNKRQIEYIENYSGISYQSKEVVEKMERIFASLIMIDKYPECDKRIKKRYDDIGENIADIVELADIIKDQYGSSKIEEILKKRLEHRFVKVKTGVD